MPGQTVRLDIPSLGLEKAFERAPSTSYYWLRSWLFSSMLTHRVSWLKSKSTGFGRGKDAIKVWRVNKAPKGAPDPKWVTYTVRPDAKKMTTKAASKGLAALGARAQAGSIALEVHETGKDIDVGSKWLAIPIGRKRSRTRSPKAWRKKYPSKTLITVGKASDKKYLVEPKRYRGRRPPNQKARTRRKKVVRTTLIARFLLVHRVQMDATLDFYDSWRRLESARQKDLQRVADKIVKDMARGRY